MESTLRRGVDEGVRLIETLLWDGGAYPRLDLHLARLARGASALGYRIDMAHVQTVLAGAAGARSEMVPLRVRLTLGQAGDAEVSATPLPEAKPEWRVALAAERLRSDDPWLQVKSTRRPAYDAARANLPAGLDEVILTNERSEVCDGSITTVFFDRGAGLRTPPLTCGLLPGVLRAGLSVPDEVLLAEDLPRVRLWVGNALRGLIPAIWAA